ncbi:MAG: beta-ketoacyl-ACP synthase II [Dehalococcoidales bacterium]|nr:beta-ketoacyl-ACP synthase II [Dehalococcoidales bacterium]MDD4322582.1 beta-ketoacyl-ACP synthase II [Dehalococcoidales bacterium]MDD4794570.1 beta-ketoacyl-ACP synthase II [Dehalococcoidales bacterium]MDD5122309.1 beta-ketoacyl-ACP synthase II [Dehalococcoidales bacterium]MDD5498762.1 beta-ketoacyl-ACP synthase II [Dehalococcoidales bacterium]
MASRVVVTGYGAVSPLGVTADTTWQNLISSQNGIDTIKCFDASTFPVKVAGEVKNFDPVDYMDPKTARYTDRFAQFAIAASRQAIEHSGLVIDDSNRYDIGILIGTGIGGTHSMEEQVSVLNSRGPMRVSPFIVPMMIADNATGRVSIETGIRGFNLSLVSACSTGTDALGIAYKMVKHGELKAALAGGTDAAITPLGVAGFSQAGALTKNPDPCTASRPFDSRRDGFVIGEGSGVLVLENLESALERGAPIFAEIVGYGATSDAFHITQPLASGESAVRAIQMALKDIGFEEVGYINAHGTSTKLNDASETRAIKNSFGSRAYDIPVSSIKSMLGHMLGAAGALEAIVCCKVIEDGIIPPTINLLNPDPECDLDYVPNQAREKRVDTVISNSFGFGGHNSVLALRRYL